MTSLRLFISRSVTFVERGLLKVRGTPRTDSTHMVAAVRELSRLDIVGETLHHALNVLAQLAPDWLREPVTAEWFVRYGQRFSDYRLPTGTPDRQQLAEIIGRDGLHLLPQIDSASAPPYVRTVPAVDIVRQVWAQQYS